MTRRPRGAGLLGLLAALALVIGVLPGCGDDGDDGDPAAPPTTVEPDDLPHAPATVPPAMGDLDLEVPEGWFPIPLPSLGVGLAAPGGWQAVVLTDEALAQIEAAPVAPGFVDAARNAQVTGALLYAAGVNDAGGVTDLKLARLPDVDLDAAEAGAAASAPEGAQVDRPDGFAHPVARVRFQTAGIGEDGDEVLAEGTQWLVEGPDAVWSLIVTSEDTRAGHDALARALRDTLAFS